MLAWFDRDYFLSPMDIENLGRFGKELNWKFSSNDSQSIRMWTERNQNSFFFYQEQKEAVQQPFILGIQTPWQKSMMLKYGKPMALCGETMGLGSRRNRQAHQAGLLEAEHFASSQEPRRKRGWLDTAKEAAEAQKRGKENLQILLSQVLPA